MSGTPSKETASEIDAAAVEWVVRLEEGRLSPAQERELDAWLAGDPRRYGAFAKASAVTAYADRARALGPDVGSVLQAKIPQTKNLGRRQFLMGGAATAASLVAALGLGLAYSTRGKEYVTQRGQMKIVPLSDGTIVSLNTDSRLKVSFSDTQRQVHIEEGEVLFDVAKDKARPFIVHVGNTLVKAIGTSFVVRKLADTPVQILVREGIVEIRSKAAEAPPPVRVTANMRAVAETDAGEAKPLPISTAVVSDAEVERDMAWRQGRIAFQAQTLQQAASEFARYSETRIVFDDPSIGKEEVTGLFQTNDPVGFAQAAAATFGLQLAVGDTELHLRR